MIILLKMYNKIKLIHNELTLTYIPKPFNNFQILIVMKLVRSKEVSNIVVFETN